MRLKNLFFLSVFISTNLSANKIECERLLNSNYLNIFDYTELAIYSSVMPLFIPASVYIIAREYKYSHKFKRAKRIVKQAHYSMVTRKNSPQLMNLLADINNLNSNIILSQVINTIRQMALNMTGICRVYKNEKYKKYDRNLPRFSKNGLAYMIYNQIVKNYQLKNITDQNKYDEKNIELIYPY